MDINLRSAISLLALCFFIGCGGSSSQDSDAKHYQQLADSYYSGNTSVADININSAQQFVRYFEHNDLLYLPYMHFSSFNCPESSGLRRPCPGSTQENSEIYSTDTDSGVFRNPDQENVSTQELPNRRYEFLCSFSGTFSIEGGIEAYDTGSFNMSFNDCQTQTDTTYNGSAVLKIITNTDEKEEFYLFMEQLTAQSNDKTILVSGYTYNSRVPQARYGTEEAIYTSSAKRYLTYQYPNKSIKQHYEQSATSSFLIDEDRSPIAFGDISDSTFHASSTIYDSELGYINIDHNTDGDYERGDWIQKQYRLTGDIAAELNFPSSRLVRYSEDTNNNGTQDVGVYFFGSSHFKESPLTDITLTNLNQLTKPPIVYKPNINYFLKASSEIEVASVYYYDEDTPTDELNVSYNWYINDKLVSGENSNTLPAFTAEVGDEVQVTAVVSDGVNTTESDRSTARTIED